MVSALDIKLKHKNQINPQRAGGESKPSIALQLNVCLFRHLICAPKMCVGVEIVEPTTHV